MWIGGTAAWLAAAAAALPCTDGCQEGSIGWMDRIGTSDDASRCWEEEDAKGLGQICWV
jgi:hypothetical protein